MPTAEPEATTAPAPPAPAMTTRPSPVGALSPAMRASPATPDSLATTAPPAAPPTATPFAVAADARDGDLAPGAWGQSFARPLVADESAIATLHARFGNVRAIEIDVDAEGRATRIALPAELTGEARDELIRTLLALRYVPAECNGLRCTGTLHLTL